MRRCACLLALAAAALGEQAAPLEEPSAGSEAAGETRTRTSEAASSSSDYADYSLRPLFHTPVGNLPGYAGDPNGMLYRADHEVYHLFWQCAPDEEMAHGASWCHSVSVSLPRLSPLNG